MTWLAACGCACLALAVEALCLARADWPERAGRAIGAWHLRRLHRERAWHDLQLRAALGWPPGPVSCRCYRCDQAVTGAHPLERAGEVLLLGVALPAVAAVVILALA